MLVVTLWATPTLVTHTRLTQAANTYLMLDSTRQLTRLILATSENSRRALRRSFWKETCILFILTVLAFVICSVAASITCPQYTSKRDVSLNTTSYHSVKYSRHDKCYYISTGVPAIGIPFLIAGTSGNGIPCVRLSSDSADHLMS